MILARPSMCTASGKLISTGLEGGKQTMFRRLGVVEVCCTMWPILFWTLLVSLRATSQQSINASVPTSSRQPYIWNGNTLSPLYGTTGIACDHWDMWYFREGASQTPGTQWGSDSGQTADEVVKKWQQALQDDAAWKKAWTDYHMTWKPNTQTWENALGPICVSEAAFSATPETVRKLSNLTDMADQASSMMKTARESINLANALASPRGKTPTYYDRTSVEDFLEHLTALPRRVLSLRARVLHETTPSMDYVSSQIAALDKEVRMLRAEEDRLANKYPVSPAPRFDIGLVASCVGACGPPDPLACAHPSEDLEHVIAIHPNGSGQYNTYDYMVTCESGAHYILTCNPSWACTKGPIIK